jgi:hypothetical protein
MTVGLWIPLEDYLSGWAENLFPQPDLDALAVVGHSTRLSQGVSTSVIQLELSADLTLALPGVDVITLHLLPTGLTFEVDWTGPFRVRVLDLGADLVITSPFLVPVTDTSGTWEPVLQTDGTPQPVHAAFSVGTVELDGLGGLTFSSDLALSLGSAMLGDTGFVVTISAATPSFSGQNPPPDTAVEGFRGLLFDRATLYLPDGVDLPRFVPDSVTVTGGAIGTGGFSGTFAGSWDTNWTGSTPSGDTAGTILGFAFALESLQVEVQQDTLTGAALVGGLAVPFFDEVLTVSVSLDDGGAFAVTVSGTPDSPPPTGVDGPVDPTTPAIATFTLPGVGTLRIDSLGLVHDDDGTALLLSGQLDLVAGAPALTWPTIAVQDLRIAPDGTVHVPGGWIDLPQPLALDLYGFGMEVTRIGFGTEDDGRRWVGVDGAVRLTELLPAGASTRGLRVIWDPADPGALPQIALDGLAIDFAVPGALSFSGEVALTDDPQTGEKRFTGALAFGLDVFDIGLDAAITVGRLDTGAFVFVRLGLDLPIPVGATGTALYGLEGLLALGMAPTVTDGPWTAPDGLQVAGGDWYGWYKSSPSPFSATDPVKWQPQPGAWAIGAGLSLGTLPDAGFSVNTRALLVAVLPGPVLLLQGTADILKAPKALSGSPDEEGTLGLLAALDGRAATLQLGIDASWSLPVVLSIAASTEAFFDFDRPDAWHLWIGQDSPASTRIRADVLALFQADAWLMLDAKGIATGLRVAWGDSWRFGPARVSVTSWIGGHATLSRRPGQLSGGLDLGGRAEVGVGPFGLGIGVHAHLAGHSPTPYQVSGELSVSVGLPPPLKDLDVDIALSWQAPGVPTVEDPWVGAVLTHPLCTESWVPVDGGSSAGDPALLAPVVPLDAGILLTFAQPMGDRTGVADNPPVQQPATAIGDHTASYALSELRLWRRRRSRPDPGWQDVTDTLFGTWTPDGSVDGEIVGARLQLMTRSPFAFTRWGSRRWVDGFLAANPEWPCLPQPPLETTCLIWNDQPIDAVMPTVWEQEGAVLSTGARLVVVPAGPGRALRLGSTTASGQVLPGRLWVSLPDPAAEVAALVEVPSGDAVLLQGWADGAVVDHDLQAGSGLLQVRGIALDAVTLDWGLGEEAELASLCWVPAAADAARRSWNARNDQLAAAAGRWSDIQPLLEPDCHYRLEVTTTDILVTTDGGEVVQDEQTTHAVEFATAGPPGIAPDWLTTPPAKADAFPFGGALADLSPYVLRTVPDPGAAPVFTGYDLACTFAGPSVPQLYGGDLVVRVFGDDGQEVGQAPGAEPELDLAWPPTGTTTLSSPDVAWVQQLLACTGAPLPADLRPDDTLRAALPTGSTLPPGQALTARIEATRPLFTDPFTDLNAFDQQVLATAAPVSTCSAAGGQATIARPKAHPDLVVALAGDPQAIGGTVTCAATPRGAGDFGLVNAHGGPNQWVALKLTVGRGRRLVRVSGSRPSVEHVLWQDQGSVRTGLTYRLALTCTGTTITAGIDDFTISVPAVTGAGRFGLLSGIAAPDGCQISDLLARSAPARVVHSWRFTTSGYAGLSELLAGFAGHTWPADAAPDRTALAARATTAAATLTSAQADLDTARAELADAVASGSTGDLAELISAALGAVADHDDASAEAFRDVSQCLGLGYQPRPPVIEILTVTAGRDVVALALELPEPLPRERLSWSLTPIQPHPVPPLTDLVVAWSGDGARALLVRPQGTPFSPGRWSLHLELALDVGAERATWSRDGDSTPETAVLTFSLP